jgi:hypothetical protein
MRIQVVALSVGLAWFCIPKETMAQAPAVEDADAAKAAVRFQQGVEMYREGSYEGALAEFQKAYHISPSYRVLYNIAQTQYALHDFVGAQKSLAQYVSDGRGEIPAERRTQVEDMSAKLADRIAHLQISANVVGADIRVDDVSVGPSPLSGLIPVNAGTRKISAFKPGSPEAVRVLTVAGKESVTVELHIDQPMARPTQVATTAVLPSVNQITKPLAPSAPSRTGLIISLSTTAALAVGTGVFGYLALGAQKDLKDQVNTYPNTREKIEQARTRSKNLGYVTDALGAATLVSGGVALYLGLSNSGASTKPKSTRKSQPFVLAPTVGGVVLLGNF